MRPLLVPFLAVLASSVPCPAQEPDTSHRPTVTIHVVTPPSAQADTPLVQRMPPGSPLLVELTRTTRRLLADTLHFYSGLGLPGWPYIGEPINASFESLFQPFYPGLAFPHAAAELFGVGRIVLDHQRVGYVLRVPGIYAPSALDLWIYDATTTRFTAPIRVAEGFADEGCGFELESLLVNGRPASSLALVFHKNTFCTDLDTGQKTSADSLWMRYWTAGHFASPPNYSDSTFQQLLRALRQRR